MDPKFQCRFSKPKHATLTTTSSSYSPDLTWVIDSGATHQITSDLSNLSLRSEYQGGDKVSVGSGQGLSILHTGSDILQTPFDFKLHNILHVFAIFLDILSIHQFVKDNNCGFIFDSHCFQIQGKPMGKIVFHGRSENGLYPFHHSSIKSTAFLSKLDLASLWHSHLSHPSSEAFRRICTQAQLPRYSSS